MKNAVNKVVLSGYAGADAEVRLLNNNQKVARVNLAINENIRTKSGEEIKKTQWFMLVFWNEQASKAEQEIKKGSFLNIEGRLQTGSYETKEGIKRYTTDIIVQQMEVAKAEITD